MVLSELVVESLKSSVGLVIGFYLDNGYYFEGEVLGCDGQFLKYKDRKTGIKILSLEKIKEVSIK